ncbi:MAG: endonuclease/exonuclease/phosphatase family protein [Gammaproteobacteria bacterium]|nr:endonuclease/exonuclease/phosphatase family protein [Gammaproteobacteria bacterium]NNK33143.1 EEP domain-containing protein [Xanthomonadales bacterium]
MSFNIQAGTSSARYHHYVTHSWRQVLPHTQRVENLDSIAELVATYDMVGLQEVDSGSLRSGFINQSRYLATHAGMPFWCHQSNRKVGKVAYAGNGFLSRFEPDAVEEHRLPGFIPGRGTLLVRFGNGFDGLDVAVVHLALGKRARTQQLKFLSRELDSSRHLVVMGDFNTQVDSPQVQELREVLALQAPTRGLATYPSWQPQRAIDHILVSRTLRAGVAEVFDVTYSDHCPVAVEIELPEEVELQEATRPVIDVVPGRDPA